MGLRSRILLCAAAVAFALPARASVNISSAPTKNVVCTGGVCAPTAKGAILNVTDLENLLATSDVTVNTGAGAVTIEVTAPLAWASSHRLTLDADFNVSIKAAVAVQGTGALTLRYDNGALGGQFLFFPGGKIDFWDTASSLVVNGVNYVLVNDIATLASLIASNQYGDFALAKDYDAGPDGTYDGAAVPTDFEGVFEGLGHTIANFSAAGTSRQIGLFSQVGVLGSPDAALRDIDMENAHIAAGADTLAGPLAGVVVRGTVAGASSSGVVSAGKQSSVGGLIGSTSGSLTRSSSTASVKGGAGSQAGGLVGRGAGISFSHASGNVQAGGHSEAGGLAGFVDGGDIVQSYATGTVTPSRTGTAMTIGGLVGDAGQYVDIVDSYSTGQVEAGDGSDLGGMIGYAQCQSIRTSYSTSQLTLGGDRLRRTYLGGFAGESLAGEFDDDYWDVDTSGTSDGCGKVHHGKCNGITGLSDAALKSGLPGGFDPAIWGQSSSINNGYPYLLNNPPD
jgi:hypothetical protein